LVEGGDDNEHGRPTRSADKFDLPSPERAPQLPIPVGPAQVPGAPVDARSELDRRIATAPVGELPALLQARGAIIDQDERRIEGVHIRRGQMGVFYSKIGFSIAAAVGGTTLIVAGFGLSGFFLLGGAAAVYVPEYVKNAISHFKPGDDDA
jgi:hypothetical protein